MSDEDWDEEVRTGISPKRFEDLSVHDEQPQRNDFGGRGRSRGRGFGRGMGRGSDNWRSQNYTSPPRDRQSNGFGGQQQNGFGGGFGQQNVFGQQNGGQRNGSRDNVTTVEVNNDSVGKVIGKGGSTIRDVQEKTGARIRVLRDDANNCTTPVEITGTEEQRKQAKQMVEDLAIPAGDLQAWADKQNRECEKIISAAPCIDWGNLKSQAEEYKITKWAGLPDIVKDFYHERKHIARLTTQQVEEIREKKNKITVNDLSEKNRKIPNPILSFEDAFDEYPEILDTIRANKFTEPSPIQSQAWPVLLNGLDCIGIAQTGTGKTLAFLLPAFIHIDQQPVPREERGGPSCLVLSPTRELAQQIETEVKKYHYRNIRSVCIYGGGDRRAQINLVKQGVEIIIGTPGRLNDLLMNGFFNVKSVTYLILDEADRMLDMGFEPEIKKILLDIRPDRQTIMTSATWPPGVQRMADKYLRDPMRVNVGSLDLQACHSVSQLVEFIDHSEKEDRVMDFIEAMEEDDKLIIFVGRKTTADEISCNLSMRNTVKVGVQCIHGDRDQADREQALADMKSGEARVLIATDVASRGLDIKDLTHVLNYDFPRHIEDYVHRIGRTGRAGRSGCALTFVTREDWMHVGKLIPIMEEAGQEVPQELRDMAERFQKIREERGERYGNRGGGGGGSGCHNCGEEGHFARECPSGRGGGGRGGGRGGRGGRGGFREPSFGDGFRTRGRGRGGRRREEGVSIGAWDAV